MLTTSKKPKAAVNSGLAQSLAAPLTFYKRLTWSLTQDEQVIIFPLHGLMVVL